MTYRGFGYVVDSCPTSETEFISAATRLNCSVDQYGRNQYTCVPNEDRTSLVEFCYRKIVGLYQKGHCLETVGDGYLDQISCDHFQAGCPKENFRGADLFKFSACSKINTENQCFYADPSCPNTTISSTSNQSIMVNFLNTTTNATMKVLTTETSVVDQKSSDVGMILGIILSLLLLLSLVFAFIFWKRRRSRIKYTKACIEMGNREETKELNPSRPSPDTKKLSTLTDDEVSVLFCFLCSDSGPPDFPDTEWLDLLNLIRQDIHREKGPLRNEEAQLILDRLHTFSFLWEINEREYLTEDAMYEILIHMTKIICNITTVLKLSSYFTIKKYLRSSGYTKKPDEKCIIGYSKQHGSFILYNQLLLRRLQMDILTHVTMEDKGIFKNVTQFLMIPKNILQEKNKRRALLNNLKQTGQRVHYRGKSHDGVDHVTWLWRYGRPDIVRSCIGLHPHTDIYVINNMAYRKPSQYHNLSTAIRCLLYSILLANHYTFDIKEQSHMAIMKRVRERYFKDLSLNDEIDLSIIPLGLTKTENGCITFTSENIRHKVMYAFVTECLVKENDLKFFLTTATQNVISEYCRSWDYKRSDGERCLYLPYKSSEMQKLFIDKLQLDVIIHCTMSDSNIHAMIINYLKIPEEVIKWDKDARGRFIKISSKESVSMCRARGMIVGCANAGKTTLLKNLQRTETDDIQRTTDSTIGLEIHDDLFEIKDDTLIDFSWKKETEEDIGTHSFEILGKQILSITDFAGQVAYYACHQIYLSKRAFYLIVMDMSKGLDEVVHTQGTDEQNSLGSLFHGWRYKDYFLFWLQSIRTYCEDEKTPEVEKETPVILIASHHDCLKQKTQIQKSSQTNDTKFYDELEMCLPKEHTLRGHISPIRYHEIECPKEGLNEHQAEMIEKVRKCIVSTARTLVHWGEKIPLQWTMFELFVRENKEKRIISMKNILHEKQFQFLREIEIDDMLRFYKEIGLIIYFAEEGLKEHIIVDVQWFVDAFKNIITDPKHAHAFCKSIKEWEIFMNTGRIYDSTLVKIWGENSSYLDKKNIIIPYMEKLGIIAILRSQKVTGKKIDPIISARYVELVYYIPSLNRTNFSTECRKIMNDVNKTPVLVFYFKTYIPHFFFFRLVAKCFSKWEPLSDDLFCKNVAFYKDKGGDRNIAIAVNKTSIQLQVFTPDKAIKLKRDKTKEIRSYIEKMIKDITTTFHHRVRYDVGYQCKDIIITDEDHAFFLDERIVAELETNERVCPNYIPTRKHEEHKIVRDDLLYYWYMGQ